MLLQLAWKNIWRNKKRSGILIITISIGLLGGLLSSAINNNMVDEMVRNAVKIKYAHLQIHHPKYLSDDNPKLVVEDVSIVEQSIKSVSDIEAVSSRLVMNGLVATAKANVGLRILGIDPEDEHAVTGIGDMMVEGTYLTRDTKNGILLSDVIAKKLEAKIGSRVVISGQNKDGEIVAQRYKVTGIFRTKDTTYNYMVSFVNRHELSLLTGYTNNYQEIMITVYRQDQLEAVDSILSGQFPNLDIQTWKQLAPELMYIRKTNDQSFAIVMGIILLAMLFGIVNTMLMAVLERTRELGILMAVGLTKFKVFGLIITESVYLSLTGGIVGMILSYFTIGYFEKVGIDLSMFADGLGAYGIDSMLRPSLPIEYYATLTVMIIITAILSALYPAIKATKLKPAEAIRVI